METLIDFSKAFGWLAAIIVNLLIAWIVWSLHKKFMNRDDCEANRKADKKERERFIQLLTAHEQAVRELNLRVDQMPPQGSVHDLEVRLERMDGEQKRLAEEISGLRGIMERVERQVDLLFRGHMKD